MSAYFYLAVKLLEEYELRESFGPEYERYQQEVPMLVRYKSFGGVTSARARPGS